MWGSFLFHDNFFSLVLRVCAAGDDESGLMMEMLRFQFKAFFIRPFNGNRFKVICVQARRNDDDEVVFSSSFFHLMEKRIFFLFSGYLG